MGRTRKLFRTGYRTTNRSSCNVSVRKRGGFAELGRRGHDLAHVALRLGAPAVVFGAAIQFCLSINLLKGIRSAFAVEEINRMVSKAEAVECRFLGGAPMQKN